MHGTLGQVSYKDRKIGHDLIETFGLTLAEKFGIQLSTVFGLPVTNLQVSYLLTRVLKYICITDKKLDLSKHLYLLCNTVLRESGLVCRVL